MNRLIATLLSLITTFLVQAQGYQGRGDYEMDEEDIISQSNWEHFNFSGTEQFLMLFGVIKLGLFLSCDYRSKLPKKASSLLILPNIHSDPTNWKLV